MIELTKNDIELMKMSAEEMEETHRVRGDDYVLDMSEWTYEHEMARSYRALQAKLNNVGDCVIALSPFDYDVTDRVFAELFLEGCKSNDRDDGLTEIPAASYQLVVSALEAIRWELSGDDYTTLRKATAIVERLRDMQKRREWKRERSKNA